MALVDRLEVSLTISALVLIRTSAHSKEWLDRFIAGIENYPEVVEAARTRGEIDDPLNVTVPDIAASDASDERPVEKVDLYDVRSTFVMESIKHTTARPLNDVSV